MSDRAEDWRFRGLAIDAKRGSKKALRSLITMLRSEYQCTAADQIALADLLSNEKKRGRPAHILPEPVHRAVQDIREIQRNAGIKRSDAIEFYKLRLQLEMGEAKGSAYFNDVLQGSQRQLDAELRRSIPRK